LLGNERDAMLLVAISASPTGESRPARYRERVAFGEFKQPLGLAAECNDRYESGLVALDAECRRRETAAPTAFAALRIAD
jgi:hypothetical protein